MGRGYATLGVYAYYPVRDDSVYYARRHKFISRSARGVLFTVWFALKRLVAVVTACMVTHDDGARREAADSKFNQRRGAKLEY